MSPDNASFGWDTPFAPYFVPFCRRMLDNHLLAAGLRFSNSEPWFVRYGAGRCWLQLHYMAEDSPRYSPMVSMGLRKHFWSAPALDSIGLWYAIPPEDPAHTYPSRYFSSEEQLAEVLRYLRDEVIDAYARPLWQDTRRLAVLIRKRQRELRDERRREALSKVRRLPR